MKPGLAKGIVYGLALSIPLWIAGCTLAQIVWEAMQ